LKLLIALNEIVRFALIMKSRGKFNMDIDQLAYVLSKYNDFYAIESLTINTIKLNIDYIFWKWYSRYVLQ